MRRLIALFAVLVLFTTACGGGDDEITSDGDGDGDGGSAVADTNGDDTDTDAYRTETGKAHKHADAEVVQFHDFLSEEKQIEHDEGAEEFEECDPSDHGAKLPVTGKAPNTGGDLGPRIDAKGFAGAGAVAGVGRGRVGRAGPPRGGPLARRSRSSLTSPPCAACS